MTTHERFFRPVEPSRTPAHRHPTLDSNLAVRKADPGCGSVARNRARRYLAKRRLPKGLWPIVMAVILIAIIFDRQVQPVLSDSFASSGQKNNTDGTAADESSVALHTTPSETGAELHGQATLRHAPPADFQARHAAQMVAFLIRNRGKLDNDVVREKWRHLDQMSLPLAVYLREIEASNAWCELDAQISTTLIDPSARLPKGMPRSLRHQKIVLLLPEWQRRGETLLSTISGSGGGDGDPNPNVVHEGPDDPGDDKPRVP